MSVPPSYPSEPQVNANVPSHMVWAILITVASLLLCCTCLSLLGLVTGIVAIVFASKVNSALKYGDIAAAESASRQAKIWCWVTTAIVILSALYLVYAMATGDFSEGMERFNEAMEKARQQQGQ